MKKFILSCIFFFFVGSIFSQTNTPADETNLKKGDEIIQLARKAVDKDSILDNVKTLYIKKSETRHYDSKEISSEYNYYSDFSNKLKSVFGKLGTDEMRMISIWNGIEYSEDTEFVVNGKAYSVDQEDKKNNGQASKKAEEQYKILPNVSMSNKDEKLASIMWYTIFPVLLKNPFDKNARYEYVGKAESPTQKADIVDIESDYFRKFRLFFDEKTHLLLMMTVTTDTSDELIEEKYFYSNYELINGLLICKKIKKENLLTKKVNNTKPIKTNVDIFIEELKINPTFKENFFKIN